MFTSEARNTSVASPNSWGVGGAVSPHWGPGAKPREIFGIFGLLGAILDGSGETFRGAESYHLISESWYKQTPPPPYLEKSQQKLINKGKIQIKGG